ncbi:MAG TPA: hypothetical protein VMR66_06245, partial [Gemmatimonadota bacterium]|nr:hypothetical protein [Gemmatimonadota bacterium]
MAELERLLDDVRRPRIGIGGTGEYSLGRMNDGPDHRYRRPTANDQADFLLRLYFGSGDDTLLLAINRAHQDLSRTVHGIGEHPAARPNATQILREAITNLAGNQALATQEAFDSWHRRTCESLCTVYALAGYTNFTIGQAQKWLNMTLKYLFVFGEARLPGYEAFYHFCHVPIDNIILQSQAFAGLKTFEERWSRISDYDAYIAFQHAVRERFPDVAPLAVEFWAWQGT